MAAILFLFRLELPDDFGGFLHSSQALGQRLKTGKFTSAELERIAEAMGGTFVCCFRFPDGTEI